MENFRNFQSSLTNFPVVGFIQAGGRSSRMGTDKAWLEIEHRPMIERVLTAAGPIVERLHLIINTGNPYLKRYRELAESYGASLTYDMHDHRGPLGGIGTALACCESDRSALILACDMPFLTKEFLAFLVEIHQREENRLTLPIDHNGRLQPLAGIYSASCLPAVEQMLQANDLRVDHLCRHVETRQVGFVEFASLANARNLFVNINSMEEYLATKV
jgi:molybdenum cofactor guanylyltransferase